MKRLAWLLALLCAPALGGDITTYLAAPKGGAYGGGFVYALGAGHERTTLYDFCADMQNGLCFDGRTPMPEIVEMPDGSLIGATLVGGLYGSGVIFRLQPLSNGEWAESTVVDLCSYFGDCAHFGPTATLRLTAPDEVEGVMQTPEGHGMRWRLKIGPPNAMNTLQTW